jgi:hypothetical protein
MSPAPREIGDIVRRAAWLFAQERGEFVERQGALKDLLHSVGIERNRRRQRSAIGDGLRQVDRAAWTPARPSDNWLSPASCTARRLASSSSCARKGLRLAGDGGCDVGDDHAGPRGPDRTVRVQQQKRPGRRLDRLQDARRRPSLSRSASNTVRMARSLSAA